MAAHWSGRKAPSPCGPTPVLHTHPGYPTPQVARRCVGGGLGKAVGELADGQAVGLVGGGTYVCSAGPLTLQAWCQTCCPTHPSLATAAYPLTLPSAAVLVSTVEATRYRCRCPAVRVRWGSGTGKGWQCSSTLRSQGSRAIQLRASVCLPECDYPTAHLIRALHGLAGSGLC